jgi:hypothetical protein
MTRLQKYSAFVAVVFVAGFTIVPSILRLEAAGRPLGKSRRTGEWKYNAGDFIRRLRYEAWRANKSESHSFSIYHVSYDTLTNWLQPSDIRSLLRYRDDLRPAAGVSSVLSSRQIDHPSTLRREAAFLLAGYLGGEYPPELDSSRMTDAEIDAAYDAAAKLGDKIPPRPQTPSR